MAKGVFVKKDTVDCEVYFELRDPTHYNVKMTHAELEEYFTAKHISFPPLEAATEAVRKRYAEVLEEIKPYVRSEGR